MSLSLNTWYRIAFPFRPGRSGILAMVQDDPNIPSDSFVLVLESDADPIIEKIRMTSVRGETLALCSNAMACINGATQPVPIEISLPSGRVWTQPIHPLQDWMVTDPAGETTFSVYFTLIDEYEDPFPCDDDQAQRAIMDDNWEEGTVGAYPMVFAVPGGPTESGGPGKILKIIWRSEL